MSRNDEIYRQLGKDMPGERPEMKDMTFSVRKVEPQEVEEEPKTVPNLLDGVALCMPDTEGGSPD